MLINKTGLYLKQKLLFLCRKIKFLTSKAILGGHKIFIKGEVLMTVFTHRKCSFCV